MIIDTPTRRRELLNHHIDSTIWDDIQLRDDDIVIATYGKSGTTWTQQIVGQLIHAGDPGLNISAMSPWIDLRVPTRQERLAMIEAQTHRRFLKSHLPADALRFDPRVRYLYCARDGRDVVWSLHNHHINANALWFELINDTPGRVGPPIPPADPDIRRYFRTWLEQDGAPFWPFWDNVRSWWAVRNAPNVMMLHYADLKRDLPGQIRRIAAFLDIELAPDRWDAVVEHCGFAWMKRNAAQAAPLGGICWEGGADTFINKGENGRWQQVLNEQDIADYEARAVDELGPECARWLAEGTIPAGAPDGSA